MILLNNQFYLTLRKNTPASKAGDELRSNDVSSIITILIILY